MVVQQKPISFTAHLPTNWINNGWFAAPTQGTEAPTGISIGAPGAINVPTDPCDGEGKVSDSKTPADVIAALQARTDLVVSNVIDTTLGGYAGKRVDIQAPADLSACTDLYIIMAEPGGAGYHVQGPSNKIQMWIVDVEGQPTVFQIESFAGTPPRIWRRLSRSWTRSRSGPDPTARDAAREPRQRFPRFSCSRTFNAAWSPSA
jgi:hypothetical protein